MASWVDPLSSSLSSRFPNDPSLKSPRTSVIVVNWNRQALLRACLTSLKEKTRYPNFDVTVVDNGSRDGSWQMVSKEFPWVELVRNEDNLGCAAANNRGIKKVLTKNTEYLLLLHNDTVLVDENWLGLMVEMAESDGRIGIVGCKLIRRNGRVQQYSEYDKPTNVKRVVGATMLIKRAVIERIGQFDQSFGLAFEDDVDYCLRARKSGFRVVYTPDTRVIHFGAGSTEESNAEQMIHLRWKNYARVQLLNSSLREMLLRLRWQLFERKNNGSPTFSMRQNWHRRLHWVMRAYLSNLREMGEILNKRRNRLRKITYKHLD
jgi:GT2 family glycosyltransferase